MGSAIAVRPPPEGFLRVYHLTTAEFAISDIGLGRIKVARFLELNDPFELLSLNILDQKIRKRAEEYRKRRDSEIGLLCFCKDWTSPALWAHYAAKHYGVCLGFNLNRSLVREVRYVSERINDNEPHGINSEDLLIYTKFEHWKYEEEIRVVVKLKEEAVEEGPLHFFHFNSDLQLAEVILGHRCSLTLEGIREFTRMHHPSATTFKARPAWGSFHLVPLESTVP